MGLRVAGARPPGQSELRSWYDHKVVNVRRRARLRSAFVAAAAIAALAHVVGLALLVVGLSHARLRPAVINTPLALSAWALALAEQGIDLEKFELSPDISLVSEAEVLPKAWLSRAGDERVRQVETAPRVALGADPRPPAPDGGEGLGQAHPASWRRDKQTLRAQLTDGALAYQPARTRQGRGVSSPQAERREARVGVGDAPATNTRALEAVTQQPLSAEGEQATVPVDYVALEHRTGRAAQPGTGPLQAAEGARRFDAEAVGAASDVVDQRSASDERQPARLDLSAAGSKGPSTQTTQNGPAENPGAVPRPSHGAAASQSGAPVQVPHGAQVALSAREAQRAHYEREIRRRAQSMLRFPRKLALELQQGETIVRFAVAPDGSLQGRVAVTKSAGFSEFDAEAVGAVRRAAPFPRMPEPLVINMRIAFENPVLR